MPDYSMAGLAIQRCMEGDHEATRRIINDMPVPELQKLRQSCVDLDNEIHCLVETAAQKPKVATR